MDLANIRSALVVPAVGGELYAAVDMPGIAGARLGVDSERRTALFFEVAASGGLRRAFALSEIDYRPDVTCQFEDSRIDRRCAVLRCSSQDEEVQDLFLRVVDAWLPSVAAYASGQDVDSAVARLVELFEALERPGNGDVLGLWGELFVILAAEEPRDLLRAWRRDPFELHDFVHLERRLEVKTSSADRRHQFSLEQLAVPAGSRLFVASIVTKRTSRGVSVGDLFERLLLRISDRHVALQIETAIAFTLGERWRETTSQRYSWESAVTSLAFYEAESIPRVRVVPPEVSQVRFLVEFDGLPRVEASGFPGLGRLTGIGLTPIP